MRRRCDRPGCGVDAAVRFGFDAPRLLVWLMPFDDQPVAAAGFLCRRHADALVPPRGWWVDDRRRDATLFVPPAEAPPSSPARSERVTRAVPVDVEVDQPELPIESAPESVADPGPIEWTPVPPTTSDDELFGDVTTPLLAKAFGRKRRPAAGA
jgi:hypothetical protein